MYRIIERYADLRPNTGQIPKVITPEIVEKVKKMLNKNKLIRNTANMSKIREDISNLVLEYNQTNVR